MEFAPSRGSLPLQWLLEKACCSPICYATQLESSDGVRTMAGAGLLVTVDHLHMQNTVIYGSWESPGHSLIMGNASGEAACYCNRDAGSATDLGTGMHPAKAAYWPRLLDCHNGHPVCRCARY